MLLLHLINYHLIFGVLAGICLIAGLWLVAYNANEKPETAPKPAPKPRTSKPPVPKSILPTSDATVKPKRINRKGNRETGTPKQS